MLKYTVHLTEIRIMSRVIVTSHLPQKNIFSAHKLVSQLEK